MCYYGEEHWQGMVLCVVPLIARFKTFKTLSDKNLKQTTRTARSLINMSSYSSTGQNGRSLVNSCYLAIQTRIFGSSFSMCGTVDDVCYRVIVAQNRINTYISSKQRVISLGVLCSCSIPDNLYWI